MSRRTIFTIILCILIFASFSFAKEIGFLNQKDEIENCLTRHFYKTSGCAISDIRLCNIAYGIKKGNFVGVKCLVDSGYDFNVESGKYPSNYIPIWRGAYFGKEMLKLLFRSKVPLNLEVTDVSNSTTLISLSISSILSKRSQNKLLQSAKLLLEKGANPNASARDGQTPLIFVSSIGYLSFVESLLHSKANPNIQADNGETPLMAAEDNTKIIDLLLNAAADIHLKDKNGDSAIFYAMRECQPNKFKLLLKEDKSLLQISNNEGLTPLGFAKKNNFLQKCPEIAKQIK